MSQHDYVVDNAPGGTVRADINNALAALVGNNSGASAPGTTYAYMFWADTTTGKLKQRNAANSAWIEILPSMASAYGGLLAEALLTTRGDIITRGASAAQRLAVGGANTVLRSDGTDPSWGKVTGAHIAIGSDAQGDILYFNGTAWTRLGAGTSGHFLKTQGAGANPTWAAAGGSGLVLIQAQSPSAVAALDFTTGITSTYDLYEVHGWFRPATDQVDLYARFSDDGGSTFEADASDYAYAAGGNSDAASFHLGSGSTAAAQIRLTTSSTTDLVGNAATELVQFRLRLVLPASTAYHKSVMFDCAWMDTAGQSNRSYGSATMLATAAVNGIRFLFSSGNIAEGWAGLYGIAKS